MGVLGPGGRLLYRISRRFVYRWANDWFELSYSGIENIPPSGPLIVASNHLSHLDPPIVGLMIPRYVFFMAKTDLFRTPLLSLWMKMIKTIPVRRGGGGRQALEIALRYLAQGEAVCIFPEGTRSPDGRLRRGRSGVVVLALRSGAPILPVAVTGTEKALRKGSRKINRGVSIAVRYGKPFTVSLDGKIDWNDPPLEEIRDRAQLVMARIGALLPPSYQPHHPEEVYGRYLDEVKI